MRLTAQELMAEIDALHDKLGTTSRIARSTIDALVKDRDHLKATLEVWKNSEETWKREREKLNKNWVECYKTWGLSTQENEKLRERGDILEESVRILLGIEQLSLCPYCIAENHGLLKTFNDQCKKFAQDHEAAKG